MAVELLKILHPSSFILLPLLIMSSLSASSASSKRSYSDIVQTVALLQTENVKLRVENEKLREDLRKTQGENEKLREDLRETQGETKDDSPPLVQAQRSRYAYISQKILLQFQPSVNPSDIPYEQIAWWEMIFSYIQPNDYERLHLRRLCNMFKASLKPPPKGKWTEYPHTNHASIDSLFNRCKELYDEDPTKAPTIIFIKAGEHEVEGYVLVCPYSDEDEDGKLHMVPYLSITYPMKIIGAGQDNTFIQGGGFDIQGTKEEGKNVGLKDMTISETSGSGLDAENGLSFLCKDMTFTQCGGSGVSTLNTKGRLINCVTTQCGYSGISCGRNALIELKGVQTKVDGNGTSGEYDFYGLDAWDTSSRIHLLFPLTKESVSTNNHGGGNYGGFGTIETVDSLSNKINK
jgi:hypothetical protein